MSLTQSPRVLVPFLTCGMLLFACDEIPRAGDDAGVVEPGSPAILRITSPTSGADVQLDGTPERQIQIQFTVEQFALRQPGSCGTDADCGHVHVRVDANECDDRPDDYNNLAISSPAYAKLAFCAKAEGIHNVTLELHRDDHRIVKSPSGAHVSDTITVNAKQYVPPTLTLTAPAANAVVALGTDADKSIALTFTSTNLTLKAAGQCGSDTSNCGSLAVEVDGDSCDDAATGTPAVNSRGTASPINARLVHCGTAAGAHVIKLTVVKDDLTPLLANGQPVAAKVAITAVVGPTLVINSPLDGGTAEHAADADKSVRVEFTAANMTLQPAPGQCAGAANCGFLNLTVDGAACNDPGQPGPVNNGGAVTSPIFAKMTHCPSATGQHTIRIFVLKDDFSPLTSNGAPVAAAVTVNVIGPQPQLTLTSPAPDAGVTHGTDADKSIPISFTIANLTLNAAPGGCGSNPNCGVLSVNVDGMACNAPAGPPVNNTGATTSPINAKMQLCATKTGPHTLSLTVTGDNFQPVANVNGPLIRSVTVNVNAPTVLTILSPPDGGTVTLGTDADKSVPIAFTLPNIVLKSGPGQCAGAPACGFLNVNIDGNACNDPGFGGPVNNGGATTSPINARFNFCASPTGSHSVRLSVLGDNFAPLIGSDSQPLAAQVTFTTQ